MLSLKTTSTRDIDLNLRCLRIEAISYDERLDKAPDGHLRAREDGYLVGSLDGYLVENLFCDSGDAKGFCQQMAEISTLGSALDITQNAMDCGLYLAGNPGKALKLIGKEDSISGVFVIETLYLAPGAPIEMVTARLIAEAADYASMGFIIAIYQAPHRDMTAHEALRARKTFPRWGQAARRLGMKATVASPGAAIARRQPKPLRVTPIPFDMSFQPEDFMTVLWALDNTYQKSAGTAVWEEQPMDDTIVDAVVRSIPGPAMLPALAAAEPDHILANGSPANP